MIYSGRNRVSATSVGSGDLKGSVMRNRNRMVLTVMVIFVGLAGVCSAGSDVMEKYRAQKKLKTAVSKRPTAKELVDRYTEALDSTTNFIAHNEYSKNYSYRIPANQNNRRPGRRDKGKCIYRGEVRNDGLRRYTIKHKWGDLNTTFRGVPEDNADYDLKILDSKTGMSYSHSKRIGSNHAGSVIRGPLKKNRNTDPVTLGGVSYLMGYFQYERLDAVLRKADRILVRKGTENVGGSECFVIEADTKYGRYKVWLDPEHGFHPAKVMLKAKGGDYKSDTFVLPEGHTVGINLDNVRFEKVDGIWVPMEIDFAVSQIISREYFTKADGHYKRTQFVLNPDHDKLGSFADPISEDPSNDPELTDGTRVYLEKGIRGKWQDGKVVDRDGREQNCLPR